MSDKKSPISTPNFCWDCGRQLQRKKGGGYHFKLVRDKIGNLHRVHKCYPNCNYEGSGHE